MTTDPEIAEILRHTEDYLEAYATKDRSGKGYVCPVCDSGAGPKGTGLRLNPHLDTPKYTCFGKCHRSFDLIDFVQAADGVSKGEAIAKLKSLFGISGSSKLTDAEIAQMKKRAADARRKRDADRKKANEAAAAYANKCCGIGAEKPVTYSAPIAKYLQDRGISIATAQRFFIGEDQKKDKNGNTIHRLVVPVKAYTSGGLSYFARPLPPYDTIAKTLNAPGADMGFTNPKALQSDRPVWICEGWADAASLEENGHHAISVNGVSNWGKFTTYLENEPLAQLNKMHLVIAFDSDDAGRSAAAEFYGKLRELKAPAIIFDVAKDVIGMTANKTPEGKPIKDINEAYIADKVNTEAAAKEAEKRALQATPEPSPKEQNNGRKIKALWPAFEKRIFEEPLVPIPTGFDNLDRIIGGGLFPNLYFLGALSGNGKTTFALQIADNIAKAGNDVLIFSLEMPTESYIARSLSRLTYEYKKDFKKAAPKTELEIRRDVAKFSGDDLLLLDRAMAEYKTFANDHISIYTQCTKLDKETNRNKRLSADDIMGITRNYIEDYQRVPVVIVDYLQILEPPEKLQKATPREQVDYAVSVFAEIRRELNTPVIVISSFNRNSANADADTTSFKESGLIEYTADVVTTLETYAGNVTEKNRKQKIAGQMRNPEKIIKLTVLKNRMGFAWVENYFRYNSAYSSYTDIGSEIPDDTAAHFRIDK